MNENKISTLKIAAAYIGTVVGAGFASGQEILQFFAVFGQTGLYGLLIATVLFIVFGLIIMELGQQVRAHSHLEVIRKTSGRLVGAVIDTIISFFLFGALTAMIAGSGALVNQQFGISALWGNLVMAAATVITVLAGITGVINSISIVVPFLMTSAVGISVFSIIYVPYESVTPVATSGSALIQNWLWAAILYVSYNILLAISVLGPLGANAKSKKSIRNGAVLGGLGLGLGAAAIFLALSNNLKNLQNVEVPMIMVAGRISFFIQIVYAVVLLAEIYTTAVGSLYGFAARASEFKRFNEKHIIIVSAILALAASQLGFSNLVKYLYPAVGYGGILLLVSLLYNRGKLMLKKSQ